MRAFLTAAVSTTTTEDIDVLSEMGGFLDSITVIPHPSNTHKPSWGDYIAFSIVDSEGEHLRPLGSIAVDPEHQTHFYVEQGAEGTYVMMPSGSKVRAIYTNTSGLIVAKVAINANAIA